jgi:transcriptional regulator with XRE-family HTH domain
MRGQQMTSIEFNRAVGLQVQNIRKDKGMTETEFGESCHLTKRVIEMIETGGIPITAEMVFLIASSMDTTPNVIIYGEPAKKSAYTEEIDRCLDGLSEKQMENAVSMLRAYVGTIAE